MLASKINYRMLPVRRSFTTCDAKAAAAALRCNDAGSSHGKGAAKPGGGGGGGLCAGTRMTPAPYTSPAGTRTSAGWEYSCAWCTIPAPSVALPPSRSLRESSRSDPSSRDILKGSDRLADVVVVGVVVVPLLGARVESATRLGDLGDIGEGPALR